MPQYRVINADGHAIEPPDMWERYLPEKFHDAAPKLVKDPKGGDAWQLQEGAPPMPLGLVTVTKGRGYENFDWFGTTYQSMNPGCFDGKARLEEMTFDGVDAEVLYPSQRTISYFMGNPDDEFHRAGIAAYNNWILGEFAAADPERIIPLAQISNLGIDSSVQELKDAKEKGFRGVIVSRWPSGEEGGLSENDDPFWAVAEQLDMPVHIHVGVSGSARRASTARRAASGSAAAGMSLHQLGGSVGGFSATMAEVILAGVFDRFPSLRMVAVEVGAGWVPNFLENIDDHYWRNRTWTHTKLELLPSEYFRRNWLLTFIYEPFAVRVRSYIGVSNMMWSTDYPHHRCDWPYSRKVIEEIFRDVPEGEKHKIVCDNAVNLYKLPQTG